MRLAKSIPVALIVALALGASAMADLIPPPAGAPPLRYRDAIFPTLTVTRGLIYGSAPDASGNPVTLTLDMYRPSGDTQTSRPAIVLVHGGGFHDGTSASGPVVTLARAFASRGYVAVSINYRLLNTTGEQCGTEAQPSQNCLAAALAAQQDAQAAVRWLRRYDTTYGVDPSRIAIEGTSAGAATALEVAVDPKNAGSSGNPGYSSSVGAAISVSGALPGSGAQPLYGPSDAPVLMFEGTVDKTVPYAAAAQTASEMQSSGMTVVFEALPGGGHVPMATFGDQIVTQSVDFAYDELNLARAAGQPTKPPAATIAQPSARATYRIGQRVRTRFSCAEGWGGPGLSSCRDSAGASAPAGRLDTSRPGRHTYTVTAVSPDGLRGTARITYTVSPPKLSRLKLEPARLRPAPHGPTLVRRGGMKISYRDAVRGRVRFDVLQRRHGRWIAAGSFSHRDRAVHSMVHFSGRLHGRALAPGRYRLEAVVVVDRVPGRAVTAGFRILADLGASGWHV